MVFWRLQCNNIKLAKSIIAIHGVNIFHYQRNLYFTTIDRYIVWKLTCSIKILDQNWSGCIVKFGVYYDDTHSHNNVFGEQQAVKIATYLLVVFDSPFAVSCLWYVLLHTFIGSTIGRLENVHMCAAFSANTTLSPSQLFPFVFLGCIDIITNQYRLQLEAEIRRKKCVALIKIVTRTIWFGKRRIGVHNAGESIRERAEQQWP